MLLGTKAMEGLEKMTEERRQQLLVTIAITEVTVCLKKCLPDLLLFDKLKYNMNLPVNKLFAQIAEWIWHLPPFGILLACAFLTSLGNTAQEPGDKSSCS